MNAKKMLFIITFSTIASCSSSNPTGQSNPTTVADSSCTLFGPIYTYGKDADVMDIRTVREINVHNDTYDRVCGDKANVQSH